MVYTSDAMIAVLQKAEKAFKNHKKGKFSTYPNVSDIHIDGTDEWDCFNIAVEKKYIKKRTGHMGQTFDFVDAGKIALNQLLEERTEKERAAERHNREIERHEREKSTLWLNKAALIISSVSIFISIFTFGFVIYDRWTNPVWINCNSPVNENSPTEYSDQPTDSEHYESDADANVHEN
jgi:hypothetical protein